jgi:peptide/nickel transport system substrate-binding protein
VKRFVHGLLLGVLLLAACGPVQRATTPGATGDETVRAAGPKRIVSVIRGTPVSLAQQRTQRGGSVRGLDGIEELVHAGLSFIKEDGTRAAQLAEAVPTIENGLWKVFPDGRMETTWKIKPNIRWHDGAPFTTEDLLFTAAVERDKNLEMPPYPEYELIDSITAVDSSTLVLTWSRPYIDADGLFGYRAAGLPMPRHLLEKAFTEDKAEFFNHPYWSDEVIGLGAFKVREWVRDSHTVLVASDHYVFGRPKIDEIEVRFIFDNNALTTYMLAGGDLTLGKTISLDLALQVRDGWSAGRMLVLPQNWTPLAPQFTNPDPPIVADVRFRRALMHALDRQQLADFVFSGHGTIAHSYVGPETPLYNLVEPHVVKYAYDPQRAAQIMEELGYTKRGDGFYYDTAGQKLTVNLSASAQNDIHPKTVPAVADMWQRLGVAVTQELVPPQASADREARARYPGFEMTERRNSLAVSEMYRQHSSQIPGPENRYRANGVTRYSNLEYDAWIERYLTTVPMVERMQVLGGLVRHQTENLSHMPIFHGADPTLVSNRLQNVTARGDNFTQAWNIQDWDLK